MYLAPFWSILSQAQWTPSGLVLSVKFSGQTTSCLVRAALATTGPKVTTPRVLNSSTQSSMSLERKLKAVTAFKDSRSVTHWEEALVQEWELFLSQK